MSIFGEIAFIVADVAAIVLLKHWLKSLNVSAHKIKEARTVSIGKELLEELKSCDAHSIGYACVEGEVTPIGQVLTSRYRDGVEGVLQKCVLTEHKSKRSGGVWSDVKNVIKDSLQQVPFALRRTMETTSDPNSLLLYVTEPTEASYLMEELSSTHDHFEAHNTSAVQKAMDRLFGELTKGLHESENMLLTDTMLVGIGQIVLKDGKIKLKPPDSGSMYILTKLSKEEVIKKLERNGYWVKLGIYLCAVFGVVVAGYLVVKLYRKYCEWREDQVHRQDLQALREQRGNMADMEEDGNQMCVVCLENPREVVLLECGHICICGNCLEALPRPRKCPICRQRIVRHVPVYRS